MRDQVSEAKLELVSDYFVNIYFIHRYQTKSFTASLCCFLGLLLSSLSSQSLPFLLGQFLQHFLLKCDSFLNGNLTLIDLSQMRYQIACFLLQILAQLISDGILQDVDTSDINVNFT